MPTNRLRGAVTYARHTAYCDVGVGSTFEADGGGAFGVFTFLTANLESTDGGSTKDGVYSIFFGFGW